MRVLHLLWDWKWTGPVAPTLELVAELRRQGVEAALFGRRAPPGSSGLEAHAAREGVPFVPLRHPLELARWCRRLRPDIVHVHQSRDHPWAFLAARGRGVVRTNHSGRPIDRRPGESVLVTRLSRGYVTFSEAGWRRDARRFPQLRGRSLVAPPGMRLEPFREAPDGRAIRARWGVAPDEFLVGTVMRVQRHRRSGALIEGFARALRANPRLKLVILGRGTRIEELAVIPAREMGLGRKVIFPGYVGEDYLAALRAMDLFLYMAPGSDGTCRALREAMALGLPSCGARDGMIPEILGGGGAGWLFDPSARAVADAILVLAGSPLLRAQLGAAARTLAWERFPIEALARRTREFYASVV